MKKKKHDSFDKYCDRCGDPTGIFKIINYDKFKVVCEKCYWELERQIEMKEN